MFASQSVASKALPRAVSSSFAASPAESDGVQCSVCLAGVPGVRDCFMPACRQLEHAEVPCDLNGRSAPFMIYCKCYLSAWMVHACMWVAEYTYHIRHDYTVDRVFFLAMQMCKSASGCR